MTYFQFLLVFIIPVILVLFYSKRWQHPVVEPKVIGHSILLLSIVAFIYTTPWDNYLVYKGVWEYPTQGVLFVIGYVPIEEYTFFILQTAMSGLLFFVLAKSEKFELKSATPSFLGTIFWILVSLFGFGCLFYESTLYMGLILAWAGPVLALQWGFGGRAFSSNFGLYLRAVGIPTVYLWICDSIAIHLEVWSISKVYTTGIFMGILPIEEALFFLITNLLVVQGIWLFVSHRELMYKLLRR